MRHALGLVAAAVVLGTGAGGGPARVPSPGPGAEVRAYVAALDRHDPAAVCATFAPALRAYERRFDNPTLHPITCAAAVAGHFTYYSDERWRSARIVAVRSVHVDRRGIAAVTLTLDHHYVCVPPYRSVDAPCATRTIRRPDVVYLTRVSGAWRVVKPGLVFRATELASPFDSQLDFYPPGDARTVARPVRDFGTVRCPATRVAATGRDPVLVQPGPAPWLSLRRLSVARLPGGRTCFALTVRARPRPDTSYAIGVSTVAQAAPADLYEVEFDGLGGVHVLRDGVGVFGDPAVAPALPEVALRATELDIVAPREARLDRLPYLASAGAMSLQLGDPLLRDPLQAQDGGMPYGGCLIVPSGRLDRSGNCGSVPSG